MGLFVDAAWDGFLEAPELRKELAEAVDAARSAVPTPNGCDEEMSCTIAQRHLARLAVAVLVQARRIRYLQRVRRGRVLCGPPASLPVHGEDGSDTRGMERLAEQMTESASAAVKCVCGGSGGSYPHCTICGRLKTEHYIKCSVCGKDVLPGEDGLCAATPKPAPPSRPLRGER
jgi:hypothetical protein